MAASLLLGISAFAVIFWSAVSGVAEECSYNNEIANIILETCVRTELKNDGPSPLPYEQKTALFEEYSSIWKSCSAQTRDEDCDQRTKNHDSRLDVIKSTIIEVWKEVDTVVPIWEKERGEISLNCKKSLHNSLRTCLPMIKTYGYGHGKGSKRLLKSFMNCITLELDCESDSKEFLMNNLWRNVKFSLFLHPIEEEYLKECLEIITMENSDKCAPGLYHFLHGMVFKELMNSTVVMDNINFCIKGVMEPCGAKSLLVITDIIKAFFNVTVDISNDVILRQPVEKEDYGVMPEDKFEIEKCFQTLSKQTTEKCVPGLFDELEVIVNGTPIGYKVISSADITNDACLAGVFKGCSGSMRYVVRNSAQQLLNLSLPVPFDKDSILSRPGHFEHPPEDILFPHYNLPVEIHDGAIDCIKSTYSLLEECCRDLAPNSMNVLLDRSLDFPMEFERNCVESCYQPRFSSICSGINAAYAISVVKAVQLANQKLGILEVDHLSPTPPYNLPSNVYTNIHECVQLINAKSLDRCCSGILKIFMAYHTNQQIPPKYITPDECSYECLKTVTAICSRKSAKYVRSFTAFVIKMFVHVSTSMELVDTCRNYEQEYSIAKNLPVFNPPFVGRSPQHLETVFVWRKKSNGNHTEDDKYSITACLKDISENMNLCCPGLPDIITQSVEGQQISFGSVSGKLQWCSPFCYEPLVLRCSHPEHTLSMIQNMMRLVNPAWNSAPHIVMFPKTAPYFLPRDVSESVRLCLMMVHSIPKQCAALPAVIKALIYNEPWDTLLPKLKYCHPKFYKYTIRDCPPEPRDLTLGLMMSIVHYKEIAISVQLCLSQIHQQLEDCCKGMPGLILSFYNDVNAGNDFIYRGTCSVECTQYSLNNCATKTAHMIHKILKYILDYKTEKKSDFIKVHGPRIQGPLANKVLSCTNIIYPIWNRCCNALIGAVYSVVNKESWPLDAPNLKRCNDFCYKPALKHCTPDSAALTLALVNHFMAFPSIGVKEFGNRCLAIVSTALKYCCESLVVKIFNNDSDDRKRIYRSPACTRICQVSILKRCLLLKYLENDFISLIKKNVGLEGVSQSKGGTYQGLGDNSQGKFGIFHGSPGFPHDYPHPGFSHGGNVSAAAGGGSLGGGSVDADGRFPDPGGAGGGKIGQGSWSLGGRNYSGGQMNWSSGGNFSTGQNVSNQGRYNGS